MSDKINFRLINLEPPILDEKTGEVFEWIFVVYGGEYIGNKAAHTNHPKDIGLAEAILDPNGWIENE